MLAKHRREDDASDRARAAAAASEFLAPSWDDYSLTSVMTVRKAVALSCGINPAQAWVIDHPAGDGAALAAVKEARERMKYLQHGHDMAPGEEIPLEELAGHAERLRWRLPARFPRAGGGEPTGQKEAGKTVHLAKRRTSPLDAVIKRAQSEAQDGGDWQSVWAVLVSLAQSKDRPVPLIGYVEGEGVQWRVGDDVQYLNKDAFRMRMTRSSGNR